jgi:hypothetical protein
MGTRRAGGAELRRQELPKGTRNTAFFPGPAFPTAYD